jgi:hypothetical protein
LPKNAITAILKETRFAVTRALLEGLPARENAPPWVDVFFEPAAMGTSAGAANPKRARPSSAAGTSRKRKPAGVNDSSRGFGSRKRKVYNDEEDGDGDEHLLEGTTTTDLVLVAHNQHNTGFRPACAAGAAVANAASLTSARRPPSRAMQRTSASRDGGAPCAFTALSATHRVPSS